MEVILFLVILVAAILAVKWAINGNWKTIDAADEVRDYQPPQPYDLYGLPNPDETMSAVYPEEEKEKVVEKPKDNKRWVYHVVPHKGDDKRDWAIKRDRKVIQTFARKADAVSGGRILAKSHDKGQLVIHRKDGTIQEERTYGEDPRSSKG